MTAPSFSRSSAYFEKDEQTLTLAVVDGSVDFDTTADRIVRHLDEQGVAVAFDGGKLSTRNGFAWLAMHANDHLFALSAKPLPEGKGADRGAAIAGPTSEERAKMLGVVIIMLVASRTLRRPMHGLLGGAFVGCRWRGACSRSTGSSHWLGAALPVELAGARGLRRPGDPLEIAVSVTAFLLVARHAWAQERHYLASAREALAAGGFVAFDDVVASAAGTRKERKQGLQTARQVGGRAERKRIKHVPEGLPRPPAGLGWSRHRRRRGRSRSGVTVIAPPERRGCAPVTRDARRSP